MMTNIHSFQLGTFKLMSISDGVFPVTKDFFFAETPGEIIDHIPEHFDAPLNFLFIDAGGKKILVDAGFGESYLPTSGMLLSHLKDQGIHRNDIDIVIITHGHMDHIGGLSNNGIATFPNAEYMIRKEEWEYWKAQPDSKEYQKLSPLENRMTFITSDIEVIPGIGLIHTPGHTAGHLSIHIHSDDRDLLLASDILNDPSALKYLPSYIRAEVSPKQGFETRKRFVQEAADKSALLFVCHYPFPGIGQIVKKENTWKWVPLVE